MSIKKAKVEILVLLALQPITINIILIVYTFGQMFDLGLLRLLTEIVETTPTKTSIPPIK